MKRAFRIIPRIVFIAAFAAVLSAFTVTEAKAEEVIITVNTTIPQTAVYGNRTDIPVVNSVTDGFTGEVHSSFWKKNGTEIPYSDTFEEATYSITIEVKFHDSDDYNSDNTYKIKIDNGEPVTLGQSIYNAHGRFWYYDFSVNVTAPAVRTVTFSVVNGKWDDDETTENKTESVSDGGTLTSIPNVGNKPNGGYREGSWSPSTPSTSTTITENKTYTYTYAPITVTFNANGGECATASATVGSDGKLSVLPQAERVGFGFDGWFDENTSMTTAVTLAREYTADTILVAHWTENPTTYNITVNKSGGGANSTASASATSASAGANITLTATAASNYHFVNWTSENVVISNATSPTEASFTMPSNAVTVTANFSQNSSTDHTITVTTDGHGTAQATPTSASNDAVITLSATPSSGYEFDRWTSTTNGIHFADYKSRNTTFNMVDENVTVKANFKAKSNPKKDDDDDDHHEESSSPSPEKPSWTPAKAAATIAAQKAQKQQAAATQLASIQTMLRTKTSDRAGTGRNVIDLDMTKVDILDPATVNLLLLNNRFAFNVKISVSGGLTTTIMIPANFNFRPFIKANGTMNIHEVLWSIILSRK